MEKVTISAGYLKRSNIKVPESAKPAKSVIKQSIFNYLNNDIKNKTVLDLFAGSGNLGIESISQGAAFSVFVEQDYYAHKTIQENIVKMNIENKTEVIHMDVLKYLGGIGEVFDIVFADPPYNMPNKHFLKTIHLAVKPISGILFYLHESTNTQLEIENMQKKETRNFGKSSYSIYKSA